ncbi:phage tail terminator family protein [uncultured Eubacterium sp.]|uniref:phage tail terminator family protein n=1 Tax=Eubacterium sp. TaxID=142586 RepID=UPI003267A6EC
MMDKIINGIVNQIRQIYDESKYEIYTESVEQGLKEPCFSILCLSPHIEHIVGTRYKRTLPFIIRYWSDSEETYADELNVSENLEYLLKGITVDGFVMHGKNILGQIVDGVLQFQVTYEFFVVDKPDDEEKIENCDINTNARR